MVIITRSSAGRKPSEIMKFFLTTFIGIVFGFFIGVSIPTLSITKLNLPSGLLPSIDLSYIEDRYAGRQAWSFMNNGNKRSSSQVQLSSDTSKIWVPSNPRGAERLPPGIVEAESDFYLRRLWGKPSEDLTSRPNYLVTFTVGYDQKNNIDAAVKKPNKGLTWQMTKRRGDQEVHKVTEEKPGWCSDPHLPPCAAFVEIMAPVFSRDAWRCVWHMIQNDLVHGWGLDFALRRCVEPAHEKIGVVDSQWIVHQGLPSLGNQGESQTGKSRWQGVRERCRKEWTMFQSRLANAENAYYKSMGTDTSNSTAH
ncbi:hypothetical protein JHK84_048942 [Glycine max]|nr:hypothetical protein JHK84_048942 [Glycine max]